MHRGDAATAHAGRAAADDEEIEVVGHVGRLSADRPQPVLSPYMRCPGAEGNPGGGSGRGVEAMLRQEAAAAPGRFLVRAAQQVEEGRLRLGRLVVAQPQDAELRLHPGCPPGQRHHLPGGDRRLGEDDRSAATAFDSCTAVIAAVGLSSISAGKAGCSCPASRACSRARTSGSCTRRGTRPRKTKGGGHDARQVERGVAGRGQRVPRPHQEDAGIGCSIARPAGRAPRPDR